MNKLFFHREQEETIKMFRLDLVDLLMAEYLTVSTSQEQMMQIKFFKWPPVLWQVKVKCNEDGGFEIDPFQSQDEIRTGT